MGPLRQPGLVISIKKNNARVKIRKRVHELYHVRDQNSILSTSSVSFSSERNARNVSFETLYGGQFTLRTQLIKPNYFVILPHRRSNTVSLGTLPLYSILLTFYYTFLLIFHREFGIKSIKTPKLIFFHFSHHHSVWKYCEIAKSSSSLVINGSERFSWVPDCATKYQTDRYLRGGSYTAVRGEMLLFKFSQA